MEEEKSVIIPETTAVIPKGTLSLKEDDILMVSVLDENFNELVDDLKPSKEKPPFYGSIFTDDGMNKEKVLLDISGGYLVYMRDKGLPNSYWHPFEPLHCEDGRMVIGVPLETRVRDIVRIFMSPDDVHESISENALKIGNILYLRGLIDVNGGIRPTMHLIGYNKDLEDGMFDIIRRLYGRLNSAVITDLEYAAEFWKVMELKNLQKT